MNINDVVLVPDEPDAPVKLVGGRCQNCGRSTVPHPVYGCEECGASPSDITPTVWVAEGVVKSIVQVHGRGGDQSTWVAKIALDDGPLIRGLIDQQSSEVSAGSRVKGRLANSQSPAYDQPRDDRLVFVSVSEGSL